MFPVGSLYLNINSTSPASLFGGTWEKLPEGYALWTATSGAGGIIAAGLPNITGSFVIGGNKDARSASGAFSKGETGYRSNYGGANDGYDYNFNASSLNSIYGNSDTVQPPAYKIYAWKRIS